MSSISLRSIASRSASLLSIRDTDMSNTTMNLMIAILVLLFVALLLFSALLFIRKLRLKRAITRQQLPTYNESASAHPNRISHSRNLTITTSSYGHNSDARSSNIYVYDEKSSMLASSGPQSPVPEIRITFPDEHDESGRPMSGRVVVVRVGENGVTGLEPLRDEEQLPKYEKDSGERFTSIDMERIGGLKEKTQYV